MAKETATNEFTTEDASTGTRSRNESEKKYDSKERKGKVSADYIEKKSINAQVKKRKEKRIKKEEMTRVRELERFYAHETHVTERLNQGNTLLRWGAQRTSLGKKVVRLSVFSRWMIISALATAYVWQLVFAVISLIGIAGHGAILDYEKNTLLGKFTSMFLSITSVLPLDKIGLAFWALGCLLSIGVYFTMILYFHLTNTVDPFKDGISILVMFVALSANILPGLAIFPFLLLWVVYLFSTTLFNKRTA